MFYRKPVIGLVTRSITEFLINHDVEHNTTPHLLLPDIWVDGKILARKVHTTVHRRLGRKISFSFLYITLFNLNFMVIQGWVFLL